MIASLQSVVQVALKFSRDLQLHEFLQIPIKQPIKIMQSLKKTHRLRSKPQRLHIVSSLWSPTSRSSRQKRIDIKMVGSLRTGKKTGTLKCRTSWPSSTFAKESNRPGARTQDWNHLPQMWNHSLLHQEIQPFYRVIQKSFPFLNQCYSSCMLSVMLKQLNMNFLMTQEKLHYFTAFIFLNFI